FANPHAMRDSYTTLNASLYLAGADDRWQVQLLGKNLTDEHIVSGVVDGPSTPLPGGEYADQLGLTSLPRTLAVQLSYGFQESARPGVTPGPVFTGGAGDRPPVTCTIRVHSSGSAAGWRAGTRPTAVAIA